MSMAAVPHQPSTEQGHVSDSVVTFSVSQQQLLAQHGLLLPLLRSQVLSQAVSEVALTDEEKRTALNEWAQRLGIKSDDEFRIYCRNQLLSPKNALAQAELPLRIDHYAMEHFSHRAEKRFLERKAELDRVVYSLIRVKDMGLAQELYLRIAEGEATFADLAAAHSEGDERSRNGIVGPAPLNQAHPQITERLRSAHAKQLFAPFFISPWWLVLRLEELKAATFDDDMKALMARDLFNEWISDQVQLQLSDLQRLMESAVS